MLENVADDLWTTYLAVENRGARPEKLRALTAFVDELTRHAPPKWYPWAWTVCERVVDQGEDLIVRAPLFERVLFPALLDGFTNSMPGCARWLAGLSRHLYRGRQCQEQLPNTENTELALLWSAIRHDPTDQRSLTMLIAALARWLQFSLHELPLGVLYRMNGATIPQCVELEEGLNEFCRLVDSKSDAPDYAELISACRFHFRQYREYLAESERYASYAAFLKRPVQA